MRANLRLDKLWYFSATSQLPEKTLNTPGVSRRSLRARRPWKKLSLAYPTLAAKMDLAQLSVESKGSSMGTI